MAATIFEALPLIIVLAGEPHLATQDAMLVIALDGGEITIFGGARLRRQNDQIQRTDVNAEGASKLRARGHV